MKTFDFVQDEQGTWWHYFPDNRRIRGKETICKQCGESFLTYRGRPYCSRECGGAAKQILLDPHTCIRCNREFLTEVKTQRYCSHKCAAEAMHESRPVTTTIEDATPVNANNPRYSQDANGQWWYQPAGPKRHGRTRAYIKICKTCQQPYLHTIFHRNAEYCSRKCSPHTGNPNGKPPTGSGDKHSGWKGGKRIKRGYVYIYCPDHPTCKGSPHRIYVQEHRLVMEEHLGRYLLPRETIHHINGVRDDNRIENLELWSNSHPAGQRVEDKIEWAKQILLSYENKTI